MKCQILFSGKNLKKKTKNNINFSAAEFTHNALLTAADIWFLF